MAKGNQCRGPEDTPLARAVSLAERLFDERQAGTVELPALGRELGVSYAAFRRKFKRPTGMAPGPHLLRICLKRAQPLSATNATPEAVS